MNIDAGFQVSKLTNIEMFKKNQHLTASASLDMSQTFYVSSSRNRKVDIVRLLYCYPNSKPVCGNKSKLATPGLQQNVYLLY